MNDHLNALRMRLSNERVRLAGAQSQKERDLRSVWIAQIEKEIAHEETFHAVDMSDDELLAALAE